MVINNRIWVIGAAIIMVAILALGYVLGIAPRIAEAQANDAQRQSVESQNAIYTTALADLEKDFENIEEFRATLAALQKQLPAGADLASFIGSLRQLEASSGVSLTNFGSAEALPFTYSPPIPPAVVEAPAPAEGDAAATDATATAPVAEAVDPNALVQTLAPEEFIYIGIDLTVTGSQAQVLDFVDALQHGDRRYLVNSLSITSDTGETFIGAISGYVYVLIDPSIPVDLSDDATLEETPATETPTQAATPGATATTTP